MWRIIMKKPQSMVQRQETQVSLSLVRLSSHCRPLVQAHKADASTSRGLSETHHRSHRSHIYAYPSTSGSHSDSVCAFWRPKITMTTCSTEIFPPAGGLLASRPQTNKNSYAELTLSSGEAWASLFFTSTRVRKAPSAGRVIISSSCQWLIAVLHRFQLSFQIREPVIWETASSV